MQQDEEKTSCIQIGQYQEETALPFSAIILERDATEQMEYTGIFIW